MSIHKQGLNIGGRPPKEVETWFSHKDGRLSKIDFSFLNFLCVLNTVPFVESHWIWIWTQWQMVSCSCPSGPNWEPHNLNVKFYETFFITTIVSHFSSQIFKVWKFFFFFKVWNFNAGPILCQHCQLLDCSCGHCGCVCFTE